MVRTFFFLSLLTGILPARGSDRAGVDSLPLPCMEKAERLLNEAITFMQKSYYRRDLVSWPDLTAKARQQLESSGNCDDAYAAISWCFRQLNEPHSFVMPPDRAARYNGDEDRPAPEPDLSQLVGEIRGEWLQDSIGYLTIPWIHTSDSLICERIADSLQTVIARLDSRGISRWIIDLRKNSGGNCWPMLTGVGPLLGDGIHGYFVSAVTGERAPFAYRDGSAFEGRHVICRVSGKGYHTQRNNKSIVVLTGRRTVSAGELVALAFRGGAQTCLIGEPTAGLTTANTTHPLSDGSMLVLTVCQEADRTGHICEGSIQPDKYVAAGSPTAGDDPAKTAAINWLLLQ
ncbi:S41 family peptidase [Puia dinghuensis]|uniref:Peptidase S41 n=1 Tax=Puia dinghuensis TaxID=1792502 RepID=A0A8J2U8W7_9BACT|nr:S41 family peptidase [Puia dinghuensis]GGA87163.1 peptidase S41 [Puia dinghuensis]